MNILINTEILVQGGSVQVGDSIIREFAKNTNHHYVLVYPRSMERTAKDMEVYKHFTLLPYEMPKNVLNTLLSRDSFLDSVVEKYHIDVVFTVMGPARWKPKVPHLVGFARCQMVIPESPYWGMVSMKKRLTYAIQHKILRYSFRSCSKTLWTENEFISQRVREMIPESKVYTVTSNYNQVYDQLEKWDKSLTLPAFSGLTLLTIAANYPHKNLRIIPPVLRYLKQYHPDVDIRVVLTIKQEELEGYGEDIKDNVVFLGPVTINQCPWLYEQSDVMFMPSLLECFSACYAEGMKMKKSLLVPDLGFAKGLCGEAVCYYEPVSVQSCAESICKLATNKEYCSELVKKGEEQIKEFNTYEERASKLLGIIEQLPSIYNN